MFVSLSVLTMQVLIVGDLNIASARIDVHPRIRAPEEIYAPEERQLLAALIRRCSTSHLKWTKRRSNDRASACHH